MASTYVHLSGRDLDNSLLRLNNIQVEEEEAKAGDRFAIQKCSTCSLDNPPGNQFCSRCGMILDEKKAEEIMKQQMERQQAEDFMGRLVQDEEFQAIVDRKLREMSITER
ncbi:MAG: hypothetical protein ACETWG_05230 [Candidatus Neomarinimicrobiota bacterium]